MKIRYVLQNQIFLVNRLLKRADNSQQGKKFNGLCYFIAHIFSRKIFASLTEESLRKTPPDISKIDLIA